MTVTVVCESVQTLKLMHNVAWIYYDPSYIVCGRLFPKLFHNIPLRPGLFLSSVPEFLAKSVKILCEHIFHNWLMIAFITCKSSLVPLLDGLCTSNPCRFEFSVFWVFAGRLLHRLWPLLDIQGPNISLGNINNVVNWRWQRFNVEMFEICMFPSRV